MAKFISAAAGLMAAAALSSTAGAVSTANDQPVADDLRAAIFQPPGSSERIPGLRVIVTQVNFPGVPERSACRFLVRAINGSKQTIGTHALLRTFDSYQASLNTWLVPTGELSPGQSTERIYSCKMAQSMVLDLTSASGWPGRCTIDGIEQSPCPATLQLEANLLIVKEAPATVQVKAK